VNGKLGTSEDYDKAFEAYIQKDERGKMKEEREERREERGVRV
jgi:hypothetical protein